MVQQRVAAVGVVAPRDELVWGRAARGGRAQRRAGARSASPWQGQQTREDPVGGKIKLFAATTDPLP